MNTLRRFACLLAVPLLAGAAPPARPAAGIPVTLSAQPGTSLDAAARRLVAQDLAEAQRAGERPLLLVGSARLDTAASGRPALFVQLQSPRECGSAGCNTTVYAWAGGGYRRVLDGVAGRLVVSGARHRGRADLVTDTETYVWNGTAYVDSRPAPNVDLRPHRSRPAH